MPDQFAVAVTGTDSVIAGLDRMGTALGDRLGEAVYQAALMVEAEAKKNATGPARWRDGENFPRSGGPGNVTGNLRRSIRASRPERYGELGWVASVGPGVIYGRSVEMGNPRWNRDGGYPYMAPAYKAVRASGAYRALFTDAVIASMGGR